MDITITITESGGTWDVSDSLNVFKPQTSISRDAAEHDIAQMLEWFRLNMGAIPVVQYNCGACGIAL